MKSNTENIHVIKNLAFLLGCIGLVAVMALDELYWETSILAEGWPDFSPGHIARSIIIFISLLAMFWSVVGGSRQKFRLDEGGGLPLEQLSILGVAFISVVILFFFIFTPSIFNALSLEDGVIEWGSAMLLFSSCAITAISFSKSRNVLNIQKNTQFSLALLAFVFFVMAMEEVSWFQRVLEIETPKAFGANYQNEMNLHNFYTNPIENLYYNGVFLFLVVLPFVRLLFPWISNNSYLRIFVARPFIGVIGAIACAYNFDMWNIIFTQIAFFGSMLILFAFFLLSSNSKEKYITAFITLLVITTQVLFLFNGENFSRYWEVTEYKEFFIPLALFIYSLDVFAYMKKLEGSVTNENY